MDVIENILRHKKMLGKTWDQLAANLPINGHALSVAFKRRSVNDVYLEKICKDLDIDFDTNKNNFSNEPPEAYKDSRKGISLLEIRDDIKKDLLDLKKNTAKKQHIQSLSDSLADNIENISEALVRILHHNEKVEEFIDQIDVDKLKKASEKLNQLNN